MSFFEHTEHQFPPSRPGWKYVVLIILYLLIFIFLSIGASQLFIVSSEFIFYQYFDTGYVYISFSSIIAIIICDRYLRHRLIAFRERLEDPSEVYALINEAVNLGPRWVNPTDENDVLPRDYEESKTSVIAKIDELREVTQRGWTEYRVLALQVLMVNFYSVEELRALSESLLNDLDEYAQDSSYRYDKEYYGKWKERVDRATQRIERAIQDRGSEPESQRNVDLEADELRAEVNMLLEHVANYKAFWTEGSVIVRGIMTVGAISIPLLLVMGLAPILHPTGSGTLNILNWGLLGMVGAVTAVLLGLRRSDLVEVGNTEGKKELWRAILGSVLGLVAGVLVFSIIAGELISGGHVVPNIDKENASSLRDVSLAILWAIAGGFSFERVFERVRSVTDLSG